MVHSKKHLHFFSKIKAPTSLKRSLSQARRGWSLQRPLKVVFTNGCFDLIHKGHVTYLEEARNLGDLLVVALNSDESVRKLKGPERPINALEDRLEVIAALESVSFVTWFEEETPLNTIQLLKPDILVKGGDWKPSQIVGADDVLARGGRVFSLPFVEGRSSTRIIERVRSPLK